MTACSRCEVLEAKLAAVEALADKWENEADRYDGQIAEGASSKSWKKVYRNIAMNLRKDAADLRAVLSAGTNPEEAVCPCAFRTNPRCPIHGSAGMGQ